LVSITGESSVGSSSRRIEANVGLEAINAFNQDRRQLHQIAELLKTSPASSIEKVSNIMAELKEAQKLNQQLQSQALLEMVPTLLGKSKLVGKTNVIAGEVSNVPNVDALRDLVIRLRDKTFDKSTVIALFAIINEKPMVVIACNDVAQKSGYSAGSLVSIASNVLGGGGGGKSDIAQGGGSDSSKIVAAIKEIETSLA
jgi:alanyl-tRNA synthetase